MNNTTNAFVAKLMAIADVVKWVEEVTCLSIEELNKAIYSDSRHALQAIANPWHQSG